jgi:hypothetical protein
MDLTTATPVEIDTLLAPIWNDQAVIEQALVRTSRVVSRLRDRADRILKGEKFNDVRTPADGIRLMKTIEAERTAMSHLREELKELEVKALPFENEYVRRGGWTRVFLAQSIDGHAHNGTECSTCHNGEFRTQFAWLVRYSGQTEAEIVADAGWRACTTCYPTAPVADPDALPTKMFTPDEEEAQRRREEREATRIEKARQADIKGITTPEGKPLDLGGNGFRDIAKTLRTAETQATDFIVSLLQEKRYAADPTLAWMYGPGITTEKRQAKHAHLAWWAIRAIAAKKGQTFEETFQVHEKKAEAKLRKMDRDWAKDPRNPNRTK